GALGLGFTVEFMGSRAWPASDAGQARKKLVVVVCRGGLDGLSLSPPVGDPSYASLRGPIALAPFGEAGGALKLDGTFGLHPSLAATHALALKGEARIAPAVATPDRERSHFEAQDVLESGAAVVYGTSSGWLNRSLEAMGPPGKVRAISIGPTAPLILRGKIEAASWSPGGGGDHDHRLPGILQDLYAKDALLGPALANGLTTQAMARIATADVAAENARGAPDSQMAASGETLKPVLRQGLPQARKLGETLAGFMTQPDGQQVAAVCLDGFDTHANQGAAQGQLAVRLAYLDAFLDGLSSGLGPSWRDTVVVVATEFGRTARVNGTGGTDHGTASTALLLGGALKKGGIVGDWPTLAQARLFENRDTAPTLDMRGLFKSVLRGHMGVERAALDATVFPGSGAVAPVSGVV
ncbi:MAG TPA: DUF1501 domain-containing protein, partial [Caulobacteraceae bacterium]|nr:DUF1501 domain-containing protein [Caulobacteraceae bacterium]